MGFGPLVGCCFTTFGYRNLQLEKLWPAVSVGDGGSGWKSVENSDDELLLLAIEISNWRRSGGRLPLETAAPSENPWRTVMPSYYFWLPKSPIGDRAYGRLRLGQVEEIQVAKNLQGVAGRAVMESW